MQLHGLHRFAGWLAQKKQLEFAHVPLPKCADSRHKLTSTDQYALSQIKVVNITHAHKRYDFEWQ